MATMNPSPTKPVVRYPTALLEDKELVTIHDSRLPDYKALEYGTLYPDQNKFPGLKLIFQEPLEDDRMVRRVWAGDRKDQDLYNADRKYSGGSTEHPILIRRYLFPEDGYEPLPTGTPDSQFPEAVLVEEEVTQPENRNGYLAVTRVFETLPGPLLTGVQITEKGQIATITTQVVEPGTTVTPSATVVAASVKPDSKGKSVLEKVEVPSVFAGKSYTIERPDPLPEEFRVESPTSTVEETVEGSSTPPTLAPGDLAKSEQQVTVFTKQKRTVNRPVTSLPKSLRQTATSPEKLKLRVTKTAQIGDTSASPTATIDVESEARGGGVYVARTEDSVEIFKKPAYSVEAPDLTPVKFKSRAPLRSKEETELGQARIPDLGQDHVLKSEEQITKFTKRVRSTQKSTVALPVSLLQSETSPEGLVVQVKETLQNGHTTVQPTATLSVNSEALGDGRYVVVEKRVPEVFSNFKNESSRIETLPERFRSAVPTRVTEEVVQGEVPKTSLSLAPQEVLASEEQVTKFTKRVRKVSRETPNRLTLKGQTYDEVLGKVSPFTEFITSSDNFPQDSEVSPISDREFLVRKIDIEKSRKELEEVHYRFPTQERLTLPDKLVSIYALFSRGAGDANGYGSGTNFSYDTGTEASVSGELVLEIEQGFSGAVPAEIHIFYVPLDSSGSGSTIIESKTGARKWPAIKARSHTLVLNGSQITKRFSYSSGDSGGAVSDSANVRAITNVVTIPPTLHPRLPIVVKYKELKLPVSAIDEQIDRTRARLEELARTLRDAGITFLSDQIRQTLNFTQDLDALKGTVEPDVLGATSPTSFPEGRFILTSDVVPFKHGMAKITAVVVDTTGYV